MPNLKDNIVIETRKLFSSKGYMSTSIQDIMTAAGVSKGGLYNHFKSKEELFYAVLDHSRKIWRERNLKGLDRIENHVGKLIAFLENYRDNYIADTETFPGGCIFVNLSVELDDQRPRLAREVEKGFIGLKNMIHKYLDRAGAKDELKQKVNVQNATEIIYSGAIGASVIYAMDKSAFNLNQTMTALIDFVKSLTP